MADDELRASWARTERHLRQALERQALPADLHATILDFIGHNELGVAFEWLTNALVEAHIALHPEAREPLEAAAREMNLQDNADWRALLH